MQIGYAAWSADAYKKKGKVRKVFEVKFHPCMGQPPANRFQPFSAQQVMQSVMQRNQSSKVS
jgi:hypothetical protein